MQWAENDELFRKFVKEGHAWQLMPYTFLKLSGFDVEMPSLTIRDDISDAHNWLQSYDIKIGDKVIEVKSRKVKFTSPDDWPHFRLPAFLDAKKKWDAKTTKPFAYIFISKDTGCMVSTCGLAEAHKRWGEITQFDRDRKIEETWYTVERRHLVTMDKLVAALRS